MAAPWIAATFLMPVAYLLRSPHDQDSPVKNLRMEPDTKRLTWDVSGKASGIFCLKNSLEMGPADEGKYCDFPDLSFCNVTNYTIMVGEPPFSAWILFPERDENREAAATNLSCWVHDVDFMTCAWAAGRAAPPDVQYQLSWREAWGGDNRRQCECPRYDRDGQGRHVRCQFTDISGYPQFLMVTVNGTSSISSVSCTEVAVELRDIEILTPPNLTANCNKSHSFMEWKMKSHFQSNFKYDLQIQKETKPGKKKISQLNMNISTNFFHLPNPGTYSVRIKAKGNFGVPSAWSAPQRFVCDPEEEHEMLWLMPVLVAVGTLAIALVTVLLCKRFSLLQKIFPPIPRVKDPTRDDAQAGELVAWDVGQEDCPVAELQVLREA